MSAPVNRLDAADPGFDDALTALLDWDADERPEVGEVVREIIAAVRRDGDVALVEYTRRFDRREVADAAALEVTDFAAARARIDGELAAALEAASARVRAYHERQRGESWDYREDDGTVLGQKITPLERVGIYVPGGKAAYPSSVLMNAIPARVAGVDEVIMVVPAPDGHVEDVVLAAAAVAGVDRVFTIGGAQAVAALAYGTATVPAVDKIVGPGNIYVATAKSMVFGRVGIDMIAGPSEILVISDGDSDPDWIAMDLFSQAEHDEQAQALLISPDGAFLDAVA
ncbi:MAG: histidinol dehydrogenase, partial [Gammaproteobacteria bacterium]